MAKQNNNLAREQKQPLLSVLAFRKFLEKFSMVSFCFIGFLIFSLISTPLAEAGTFTDNSSGTFNIGGDDTGVQWDAGNTWVEQSTNGTTGTYLSDIKDAGGDATWGDLSWTPEFPSSKELPNGTTDESGYSENNLDMTNLVFLTHYNSNDDDVASSLAGTSNGNASLTNSRSGRLNAGLALDGTGDFVSYGDSLDSVFAGDNKTFTISMWVKPDAQAAARNLMSKAADTNCSANQREFYFQLGASDNLIFSWRGALGGTPSASVTGATDIVDDGATWTHVVATYDGAIDTAIADRAKLYVNGVAETLTPSGTLGDMQDGTAHLCVGAACTAAGTTCSTAYYDGIMDEVAVFSKSFTAGEVEDLYLRGATRLKYQVRSCDDASCSGESFAGPDGSSNTYYTENNATSLSSSTTTSITEETPHNRYFQYKAIFESDSTSFTPELNSISQSYSRVSSSATDDANTGGEFDSGTHSTTEWDTDAVKLLDTVEDTTYNTSGNFTSRVLDGGAGASWHYLNWTPKRPSGKELPDGGATETAYSAGNIDMSTSVLLLHMNDVGGNAIDSSSTAATCTATNMAITNYSATGKLNNAIDFESTNTNYFSCGDSDAFSPTNGSGTDTAFSVCTWINPESIGTSGANLVAKTIQAGSGTEWYFNFRGAAPYTGKASLVLYSGSSTSNWIRGTGSTALSTGTWQHVCATYDGSEANTGIKIYVNGLEDSTTRDSTGSYTGLSNTTTALLVGRYGHSTPFYYDGLMDEVVMFKGKELSSTEVLDIYKRGAERLKMQVRSCDDSACSGESFVGPGGSTSTYFEESDFNPLGLPTRGLTTTEAPSNRYFQYKAFFESDNSAYTPELVSATVGYTGAAANITESSGSTACTEGGTDTYTVALATLPSSNVTITPSSSDTTYGVTFSPATLTFTSSDGTDPQTVTVTCVDDARDEASPHTASITHSASSADGNYNGISISSVTTNITDNDATPSLSINDVTGSEASTTAQYTVTLSAASQQEVTVHYASSDGTATAGSDYTATSGDLTFTAGQTTKTIDVTVTDDSDDDDNETITMTLSSPGNATISDATGTATITDNDEPGGPTPSITLSKSAASLNENGGTVTLTATSDISAPSDVTVNLSYSGTATNVSDYTRSAASCTITTGNTTCTVTLTGVDDALDEAAETIITDISSVTGGNESGTQQQSVSITDDDATPSLSIDDPSVAEDGVNNTFTVTLSAASGQTVTVDYATSNATASAGSDYTATSGTLTFTAGQTSKTIDVPVTNDTLDEASETFTMTLSNVSATATISDATGTGTITDNDAAPGISLSKSAATIAETAGTVTLTATADAVTGQNITVNFDYSGTATNTTDYTRSAASCQIDGDGVDTTCTVTLTGVDDALDEAGETIITDIGSVTNGTETGTQQQTVTITDDDATPSLSIDDPTVAEDGVNNTFTVTLSAASGQTVTVDYATSNATATAGSDYTATSGTLTFTAGQTSKTIDVPVTNDTLDEASETFTMTLSNVSATATISDATGTGTITDNDAAPGISLSRSAATLAENGGTATLTATADAVTGQNITVNFAYSGTATNTTDYTRSAASCQIDGDGVDTTCTVTLTGVDDALDEAGETIITDISSVTNGTETGTQQQTVTITDDDATPSLSINDPSVAEDGTNLTFTVTLSAASGQTVTVDYASSDGSATGAANEDYTSTSGTLTFTAGQTTKTIDVPVTDDALDETNETVTMTLSNVSATATISDATGTGTITDNDNGPAITLSKSAATLAENGGTATLTATANATSSQIITVHLAYSGTATGGGTDYSAAANSCDIAVGNTTCTVVLTGVDDALDEAGETIITDIDSIDNGTEAVAQQQTVTITDDDATPSLSIDDPSVAEDGVNNTFTVTLSAASGQTVTVDYATSNATATAGSDYTATSGTLTFTAGQTSKTIDVPVTNDTLDEASETFTMTLSNVSATATISDATGTGTITDNDAAPGISLSRSAATLAENGGTATLTATADAVTGQNITVNFAYSGTATNTTDYTRSAASCQIDGDGVDTTCTVTLTGVDDALDEAGETIITDISSVTNGTETGTQQQTVTITDDDATPSLSIDDPTVAEDGVNNTFTVTLSAASGQTVTVDYATSNATATAGSDYTATSGTLTFTAGQTSKTIDVPVTNDTLDEASETFTMTLSNVSATATVSDATGTGTITDNDSAPNITLSRSAATLAENGGTATLTATADAASGQNITVNFDYSGTATNTTDYTRSAASCQIDGDGVDTTCTVVLTGVDDALDEAGETIITDISSVTNGTEAVAQQQTVTITDDDATPSLSIDDPSVAEDGVNNTFTVTLSAASGQTVTVDYATSNSTATAGSDYTTTSGTLTFTAGQTSKTIDVPVTNDTLDEASETFTMTLSNVSATATISDATGTGTITDNDNGPAITLSKSVANIAEAAGVATLTATADATSGQTITVHLAYSGTATGGSTDYTASANSCDIAIGDTTCSVTLTAAQDTLDEAGETIITDIDSVDNGTEAVAQQQTVTITDDDATPSLSVDDVTVAEDGVNNTFTVTLSAASGQTVTVDYATSNATATAGSDYTATSGTLTFTAGQTSKTIDVPITNDVLDEASETFTMTLSNASNATISDATGTGTITDNDSAPSITLSRSAATLAENGGTATLTATADAVTGQNITVNFAYSGTATNTTDYTRSAASCQIDGDGVDTTCTVTLTGVDDALDEAGETIITDISSVTNGTETGTQQQTVTITDDDATPSLSVDDVTVAEDGVNNTFTVTLSAVSGQAVTVDYATSNATASAGSDYTATSGTLTFTAGQTSKTIDVPVSDDSLDEASETFTMTLSNASNATISDATGTGTITDNDTAPTVTLSRNNAAIAEAAGTSTLTATLSEVSGQDVVVNLAYSGTATNVSDYTRGGAGTSITITAGATTGTLVLTAAQDTLDENSETIIVDISSVTNGTEAVPQQVTVNITDDDAPPTVTLSVSDSSINEDNETATVTATLSTASGLPATINLGFSGVAVINTDYVADSASISISAGATTGSITITPIDNGVRSGNKSLSVSLDSATNATESGSQELSLNLIDDEGDLTITESGGNSTITEGGATDSFTIELATQPTAEVTVTLSATQATLNTATLVFSTENWNIAQTVTVTAMNDDVAEGDHIADVSFNVTSDDPNYEALVEPDLEVEVTDNDSFGISVTQSGGSTAVVEGGATDTITYVLTSEPTNDVTINLTNNAQLTLSAASLTFTTANWDEAQTITVTGTNDGSVEGAHSANISASVSSTDGNYAGLSPAVIAVAITDNDSAGVTVSASDGTTLLDEGDLAATDSFTVVLNSQPSNNVTITLGNEESVTLSASTLTFTSGNWSTPQTVTVTAVDNSLDDGDHDSTITFATASSDTNYNALVIGSLVANITDDDTAGITVTESGGASSVNLSDSDSYTLVLDAEPTEDVTISLTPGAGITVAPASLTFTADNWDEAQTVAISIDAENLPLGTTTTTLEITQLVSSADVLYDEFVLAPITVAVDNSIPPEDDSDGDDDDSDDGDDDGDIGGGGVDEPGNISCPVKQCIAGGSSCTVTATSCEGYSADDSCSYTWQQSSGTSLSFTDSASTSLSLSIPADYQDSFVLNMTASCDSGSSNYLFTVQTIRKTIRSALLGATWIDGRVIAADSENVAVQQETSDDEGDRQSITINDQLTFLSSSTEDVQAIYLPSSDSRYIILADPSYSNHKGIVLSIDVETVAAQTSEIDVLDPDLATMNGVVVLEGPRAQAQLGYRIALAHLGDTNYVAALLPGSNLGTLYFLNEENLEIEYIIQGTDTLLLQTALMTFPDFDGDDYSDSVLGILNAADANEDISVTPEAYDFKTIMGSDLFASAIDLDEASENYNINFSESSSVSLAISGDINQDSYDDVIMCATDACTCSIFFGSANISDTQDLQADKTITCDESSAATAIAVGDYSGDDIDDIALLFGDSDNLYVLLGSANDDEIDFENSVEIITPSQDDLTDCLVTARKPEATADGLYVCGAPNRSLRIDFGDSLITNTSAADESSSSGCSLHHKQSNRATGLSYACVLGSWALLQRARKRKKTSH